MPMPNLRDNDLILINDENIKLLEELDKKIEINFNHNNNKIIFNSDYEQLSSVFINLIKNSIASIQEKYIDNSNFIGKISILINDERDYIEFSISDLQLECMSLSPSFQTQVRQANL